MLQLAPVELDRWLTLCLSLHCDAALIFDVNEEQN
jgi:hypothetical protein